MKKYLRIFLLMGLSLGATLSLGGCTMIQSMVAGSTSGWWGRTGDDDYDPTKIAPVYCYRSLSTPDCYSTPVTEGPKRELIAEQHPYKSAKQIAADKAAAAEPNGGAPGGQSAAAPAPVSTPAAINNGNVK